jgi:rare lipoprotein A
VRNLENGKTVKCVVTDRGPAKRLYRLGRKIDLAKAAFNRIADLKQGIIPVSIVMVAE